MGMGFFNKDLLDPASQPKPGVGDRLFARMTGDVRPPLNYTELRATAHPKRYVGGAPTRFAKLISYLHR